jgi:hypothetical protein
MSEDPPDRPGGLPAPPPPEPPPSPAPPSGSQGVPPPPGMWTGPGVPPPLGTTAGAPRPSPGEPGGRVVPLKEMGVGEILDAAFNLYRRHWKQYMAIVAVLIVPFEFLQGLVSRAVAHPFMLNGRVFIEHRDVAPLTVVGIVFGLASYLIVTPLLEAALVQAVGDGYMGERPDVGRAFATARARMWSVLLVVFLAGLATVGGFVLLVIPGIIFYTRFLFSPAVVVLEGARGREAMRRSWRLVKGRTGRILLTVFLAGLLVGVIGGFLTLPAGLIAARLKEGWILRTIVVAIVSVLTTPFVSIVRVLLYFDQRVRKEGLDLAIMAQELARPRGEL